MKKHVFILILLVFGTVQGTWFWNVNLEARTEGIKLQYEDYAVVPSPRGFQTILMKKGPITRQVNLWTPRGRFANAVGRKIVIQAQAGLGSANMTNKIVIAKPYFITDEERKTAFIMPMTPSGSYDIVWDRTRPNELRATQSLGINPALTDVYGGKINQFF